LTFLAPGNPERPGYAFQYFADPFPCNPVLPGMFVLG